jgi:ribose/xylose/arabinose/galactoside ABC-type transport system permease subunit
VEPVERFSFIQVAEEAEETEVGSGFALGGFLAALRRGEFRYRVQQSAFYLFLLFLATQIASVVFALVDSQRFNYLSRANVSTALATVPLLGITTLGVGLLMIGGEFDLSVGSNYILSSIIMALLAEHGINLYLAALVGLGIGTGIGWLNSVITLRLRIPSFIATLGTMGIWEAATLLYSGAGSRSLTPTGSFRVLTSGQIGWVPAGFFWMLGLGVAFWLLLQHHYIGNRIFAAGGDKTAAVASGVNVNRAKMVAFILAGTCAAFAGIIGASQIGTVSPGSETDLPLQAIAAAVIGGLALYGGRGTIIGMLIGASLIYWIEDVLLLLGAPGYYLTAFVGALTIMAVALYEFIRRHQK